MEWADMIYIVPLLVLAGLYAFQDQLILQPHFGGDSGEAAAEGIARSRRWIEKDQYRGKIHEPLIPERGTIVLYHGNAGNVDDRVELAQAMTSRGFRAVLVEYPGFGERKGSAKVNSALSASLEDFALARARWPGPIYVAGESFGSGVATQVAMRHRDEVAGVALFTPWDSLASVVKAKLHLPLHLLLHQRLDSVEALAGYQGNVAIMAAAQDSLIPVRHARALSAALPAAYYVEIPRADHNTWLWHATPADWDKLLGAMSRPSPK
jgi:hypothetical protein